MGGKSVFICKMWRLRDKEDGSEDDQNLPRNGGEGTLQEEKCPWVVVDTCHGETIDRADGW